MDKESVARAEKAIPDGDGIFRLVSFYKALADDTRLRILFALLPGELSAGDIAVCLDMTKSAVSHQLAVLRDMHLIKARRMGKNIFYTVDDEHVSDILDRAYIHLRHSG